MSDVVVFKKGYKKNRHKRYIACDDVRVDFIAGASHLWTNVETVHRTVSLSLLASQASAFAPISGPNPP